MPQTPYHDPMQWFSLWYDEVLHSTTPEPTAMALATVSPDGQPSIRIVLLKDFDARGFVFYTNEQSQKGQHLLHNPHAALNFFWPLLNRQVRVEGTVQHVTAEEADAYFATRPRMSQIGAWCSKQSAPLDSRDTLMDLIDKKSVLYHNQPIPRPPHWTGFRLNPTRMEFWQAGDFRLHDRWQFSRTDDTQKWHSQRLYP